jgi:hypothetical protein
MWDFEIGRTLGIVARTWPFVLFRMIVYFGITVAYIAATGMGAGVGYGTGHILGEDGGPITFALWGGIFGFGLVSAGVYWIREYILYIVKAGHIAVMVHLIEGRDVPAGKARSPMRGRSSRSASPRRMSCSWWTSSSRACCGQSPG